MGFIVWITLSFAGTALLDLPPHISGRYHSPVSYMVWTSPRWNAALTDRNQNGCPVVLFAVTPGGSPSRLYVGGKDYGVDTSWRLKFVALPDTKIIIPYAFLDHVTGSLITMGSVDVNCFDLRGIRIDEQNQPVEDLSQVP